MNESESGKSVLQKVSVGAYTLMTGTMFSGLTLTLVVIALAFSVEYFSDSDISIFNRGKNVILVKRVTLDDKIVDQFEKNNQPVDPNSSMDLPRLWLSSGTHIFTVTFVDRGGVDDSEKTVRGTITKKLFFGNAVCGGAVIDGVARNGSCRYKD